jgi:hypothetical protein
LPLLRNRLITMGRAVAGLITGMVTLLLLPIQPIF